MRWRFGAEGDVAVEPMPIETAAAAPAAAVTVPATKAMLVVGNAAEQPTTEAATSGNQ